MKRILIISTMITALICDTSSQVILKKAEKFNLKAIEKKAIKKTYRTLEITDKLSALAYFPVVPIHYFDKKTGSVYDFLDNLKIYDAPECFVYDDSLNIKAIVTRDYLIPGAGLVNESLYIKVIKEINPDYIFNYLFTPCKYRFFLCYKNGDIIIVNMTEDEKEKKIKKYPLSELKDWRILNGSPFKNNLSGNILDEN